MDPAKMNATLALMTPDEVEDALRFVDICERGGGTPPKEADEWRRGILAWQGFLGLKGGWPALPRRTGHPPCPFLRAA